MHFGSGRARSRYVVGAAVWVWLAFAARSAPAQVAEDIESAKERAGTLVEQAEAAFAARSFERAGELYLEAHRLADRYGLKGRARLLYNAGLAFEQTERCDAAAELFERFLVLQPKARETEGFSERIAAAQDCAPQVTIQSKPAGARVLVEGEEKGLTPLALRLRHGEHRVLIALDGHEPAARPITVVRGTPLTIEDTLASLAGPPRAPELSRAPPPGPAPPRPALAPTAISEPESDLRPVRWAAGALAVAGVGLAVPLMLLERGRVSDARAAEAAQDLAGYEEHRSAALGFAYAGRASLAVGAASAVALGVLILVGGDDAEDASAIARAYEAPGRLALSW